MMDTERDTSDIQSITKLLQQRAAREDMCHPPPGEQTHEDAAANGEPTTILPSESDTDEEWNAGVMMSQSTVTRIKTATNLELAALFTVGGVQGNTTAVQDSNASAIMTRVFGEHGNTASNDPPLPQQSFGYTFELIDQSFGTRKGIKVIMSPGDVRWHFGADEDTHVPIKRAITVPQYTTTGRPDGSTDRILVEEGKWNVEVEVILITQSYKLESLFGTQIGNPDPLLVMIVAETNSATQGVIEEGYLPVSLTDTVIQVQAINRFKKCCEHAQKMQMILTAKKLQTTLELSMHGADASQHPAVLAIARQRYRFEPPDTHYAPPLMARVAAGGPSKVRGRSGTAAQLRLSIKCWKNHESDPHPDLPGSIFLLCQLAPATAELRISSIPLHCHYHGLDMRAFHRCGYDDGPNARGRANGYRGVLTQAVREPSCVGSHTNKTRRSSHGGSSQEAISLEEGLLPPRPTRLLSRPDSGPDVALWDKCQAPIGAETSLANGLISESSLSALVMLPCTLVPGAMLQRCKLALIEGKTLHLTLKGWLPSDLCDSSSNCPHYPCVLREKALDIQSRMEEIKLARQSIVSTPTNGWNGWNGYRAMGSSLINLVPSEIGCTYKTHSVSTPFVSEDSTSRIQAYEALVHAAGAYALQPQDLESILTKYRVSLNHLRNMEHMTNWVHDFCVGLIQLRDQARREPLYLGCSCKDPLLCEYSLLTRWMSDAEPPDGCALAPDLFTLPLNLPDYREKTYGREVEAFLKSTRAAWIPAPSNKQGKQKATSGQQDAAPGDGAVSVPANTFPPFVEGPVPTTSSSANAPPVHASQLEKEDRHERGHCDMTAEDEATASSSKRQAESSISPSKAGRKPSKARRGLTPLSYSDQVQGAASPKPRCSPRIASQSSSGPEPIYNAQLAQMRGHQLGQPPPESMSSQRAAYGGEHSNNSNFRSGGGRGGGGHQRSRQGQGRSNENRGKGKGQMPQRDRGRSPERGQEKHTRSGSQGDRGRSGSGSSSNRHSGAQRGRSTSR